MSTRRWVLGLLVAATVVLVPAGPAGAHASLLATTPSAGYSVSTSPRTLTLVFDQPVAVRARPLQLSARSGVIALGPGRLTNGDRWLSAGVNATLPAGQYSVRWQVVAEDGDVVSGQYTFAVGPAVVSSSGAGGDTRTRGLAEAVILRSLLFAALSVALGGVIGEALARRVVRKAGAGGGELPRPRAPISAASALGAVAALGLSAHLLGSGNILAGLTDLSLPALLHSRAGRVDAVEIAAFVVATLAARVSRRRAPVVAAVPLLVVVLAEGQRSHVREIGAWPGSILVAAHLAAAAIWLGTLTHVIAVAWRWRSRRAAAHRIVWEYARIALALLVVVVATGTISAVIALQDLSALTATGYGRLLLVKLGLVVVIGGCAVAARRRLVRTSPLRPATGPGGQQPGRAAQIERVLLGAVLACTALLVSIAAPGSAAAGFVAVPPPAGPVVRLATLDGEITVFVTASDGRLEVRTSTPDPTGDGSGTSTKLSVRSTRATGAIALRQCGPACFVGPAQWQPGLNRLTITATSRTWTGGTAALTVPWPPARDDRLLTRLLAQMRKTPRVTVHEAVTSNTAARAPLATTHTLTGPDFVSVEPYSHAGALPVIQLGRDDGITTIAFAMVDQAYYFQLKLGPDYRVQGEVITTPEHLYTRTFDYPS